MDISKFKEEFNQIEKELSAGNIQPDVFKEKTKRHAFLQPIIEKAEELEKVNAAIAADKEMLESGDKEMAALAAEELAELENKPDENLQQLRILMIPPDPTDSKNIYLEIRPGAG